MPRERKNRDIRFTTYEYVKTGKKREDGKNEWARVSKSSQCRNTSFAAVKESAYKESKGNKDVFVNYSKHINSITRTMPDGRKRVTYVKPCRVSGK